MILPKFFYEEESGQPDGDLIDETPEDKDTQWRNKVEEEMAGVKKLLDKHSGQYGSLSQTVNDKFAELNETLAGLNTKNGDAEDDYGFVTNESFEQRLGNLKDEISNSVKNGLVQSLREAGSVQQLQDAYGLDAEQVEQVKDYAQAIGSQDLEAAYLKMAMQTGDLAGLNKKQQLLKEKNKKPGPSPGSGASGGSQDDPALWLKNGDYDRFNQWKAANPEAHKRWRSKVNAG